MDEIIPEFTGERVIEGNAPKRIWLDHNNRYEHAAKYVKGKNVLDVSCGTGYGAYRLAKAGAKKVTGVDISRVTIQFAKEQYFDEKLTFQVGDILSLGFEDNLFDVITCFETIEHVKDPEKALEGLRRALRPGGVLIISSPNRILTSPEKSLSEKPDNPFHIKEYNLAEFISAIGKAFNVEEIYGQRGIYKIFLLSFIKKVLNRIVPGAVSPESGSYLVETVSRLKEYRYITVICRKRLKS